MKKEYRCRVCGEELISRSDRFCPHCGAPHTPERSRAGEIVITLLKCLGFYGIYLGITVLFETVHEAVVAFGIDGFPDIDLSVMYEKMSYAFCEVGIASAICVLAVFFLVLKRKKGKPAESLRLYTVRPAPLAGLLLTGLSGQFAVTMALTAFYSFFPSLGEGSAGDIMEQLLAHANPVTEFLYIAIITPLLEETLFRGIIYTRLRKILPKKGAILLSAAVFGAAHGNLEQFVYAFVLGVIMAAVFEKFDSLWASFAIHFAFNGSSYLVMMLPEDTATMISAAAVSAGLFILCLAFLFLTKTQNNQGGLENEAL